MSEKFCMTCQQKDKSLIYLPAEVRTIQLISDLQLKGVYNDGKLLCQCILQRHLSSKGLGNGTIFFGVLCTGVKLIC